MDDLAANIHLQSSQTVGVIWSCFVFAIGSCIGSFLNVVIYRLPRDKSLVSPGSMCPSCNKAIKFYHNIPILSWILLGGRCRYCKAKISAQYVIVEFITAIFFLGLFLAYFGKKFGLLDFQIRQIPAWNEFGWLIFLSHIILIASFIAASVIDLQLWVIPLSICWFTTIAGLVISAVAPLVIDFNTIRTYYLLPSAHAKAAAVALGGAIGLIISLFALSKGLIKQSYLGEEEFKVGQDVPDPADENFDHRKEALREIIFLGPAIIFMIIFYRLAISYQPFAKWWLDFSQIPAIAGLTGSFLGYLIGCGVVWATRILGTLAFGKEAMGLGDVHLMGAAGAIIGPVAVVIAFFIAPFFGLAWALYQMFFKKTRQIPYGPFLSAAVFVVMIAHDPIMDYILKVFFYR